MGGVEEVRAYESATPSTLIDAMNVMPRSSNWTSGGTPQSQSMKERRRLGSRPFIGRAYTTPLGDPSPVRMLAAMNISDAKSQRVWIDEFKSTDLSSVWTTPAWMAHLIEKYSTPGYVKSRSDRVIAGAVRSSITYSTSLPYTIEMAVAPLSSSHQGDYYLYGWMSNSSPNASVVGFQARLRLTGSSPYTYAGELKIYQASSVIATHTFATASPGVAAPTGTFQVVVDPIAGKFRCYWNPTGGSQVVLCNVTQAPPTGAGQRIGFGMQEIGTSTDRQLADYLKLTYFPASSRTFNHPQIICASAGGKLYTEVTSMTSMEEVDSDLTINPDDIVNAVGRQGVLYIADHGDPVISGDDGSLSSGDVLSATSVVDWTALDFEKNSYQVLIYNAETGATNGLYSISSIASGGVTLSGNPNPSGSAKTCSYRIQRAPKKYTANENVLELWVADAGKGQLPFGCHIIAIFQDAIYLAGEPTAPQAWFRSRMGDPNDHDYGETDALAATFGSIGEAGQIGSAITAMIPFSDDYMIMATNTQLWKMIGNVKAGGGIVSMDRTTGIVDSKAWCWGAGGDIYFYGFDGFYRLSPGASRAVKLSGGLVPRKYLIEDLDRDEYDVFVEYDKRLQGVWCFLVVRGDEQTTHTGFFFAEGDEDQATPYKPGTLRGSFWPMRLEGKQPSAIIAVNERWAFDSPVLIGCEDGTIIAFRDQFEDDDGETVTSHAVIGPITPNDTGTSRVTSIQTIMPKDTADVTMVLKSYNTAEEAYDAGLAILSGWTVEEGLGPINPVMLQGRVFSLSLSSTGRWAMEQIHIGLGKASNVLRGL